MPATNMPKLLCLPKNVGNGQSIPWPEGLPRVSDPYVNISSAIIRRLLAHESEYAVQASCQPHFKRLFQ